MSRWIPFPSFADSFPIDVRCAFGDEAPAGKHGFLKTEDTKFVFEDGTAARFWGTNFNSALCFPTHEYAEQVAERVACAGLNIVRLHQTDMEVVIPNMKKPEHPTPKVWTDLIIFSAVLKREAFTFILTL